MAVGVPSYSSGYQRLIPPQGSHPDGDGGDVYEVRAEAERQAFRILFAQETTFILLPLSGFQKKSAKTPPEQITLAEYRLADWRRRGRARKP